MTEIKISPRPFLIPNPPFSLVKKIVFFDDHLESGNVKIFYTDVISLFYERMRPLLPFQTTHYWFQVSGERERIFLSSGSIPHLGFSTSACDETFLQLVECSRRHIEPALARKLHALIVATNDWINVSGILFSKQGICVGYKTKNFRYIPWDSVASSNLDDLDGFMSSPLSFALSWPRLHIYEKTEQGLVDVFGPKSEFFNFRLIKSNMSVVPRLISMFKEEFNESSLSMSADPHTVDPQKIQVRYLQFMPEELYKRSIVRGLLVSIAIFLLALLFANILL